MNNLSEERVWSFVIRIWLEDNDDDNQSHWRGHITHVNNNERRHFNDLEDMREIVRSFLEAKD